MRKTAHHKDQAANLRACAAHGHVTYRPTDDDPRVEALRGKLRAANAEGEAWQCIVCGTYIVGQPAHSGPLSEAPRVMRGSELRQAKIMRLLALERLVRSVLLLLAAYGVFRFRNAQPNLQALFNRDFPVLQQAGLQLHVDVESSSIIHLARWALSISGHTLYLAGFGILAYAVIQLVEGTGLWLLKRWGEWFAVIATSLFLPLEIWELTDHVSLTKLGALVINIVAIAYLVYTKKLWPGGGATYERQHAAESLLELPPAVAKGISSGKASVASAS